MQTKLKFSKKELLIKLVLTFVIAIVLGVSCIFGAQIEKSLNIGVSPNKSNYVSVSAVEPCHSVPRGIFVYPRKQSGHAEDPRKA